MEYATGIKKQNLRGDKTDSEDRLDYSIQQEMKTHYLFDLYTFERLESSYSNQISVNDFLNWLLDVSETCLDIRIREHALEEYYRLTERNNNHDNWNNEF